MNLKLLLGLLGAVLLSSFFLSTSYNEGMAQEFELEILGYYGKRIGIYGAWPCSDPPVSIDVGGYSHLLFRLTYLGTDPCEITKLTLREELIQFYNGTPYLCNRTKISVEPPNFLLNMGDFFEFPVEGEFVWDSSITGGFWLEIEKATSEKVWVFASYKVLSSLEHWSFTSSQPSSVTTQLSSVTAENLNPFIFLMSSIAALSGGMIIAYFYEKTKK
ncbi:MAG: hypothetical protein ACFFDT_32575 [Candidatus Hodarchaeota archaeon]